MSVVSGGPRGTTARAGTTGARDLLAKWAADRARPYFATEAAAALGRLGGADR